MSDKVKAKTLSARQRRTRFVKEYLVEHNATQAAIKAGYSEKTAGSQGQRLLKNVEIRQAIEKADNQINSKLEISVENVRRELARLAFYDPRNLFNDDGSVKPIGELDDDTAAAICGLDVNELFEGSGEERSQVGYIKKLKLSDKGMNLERLGRHLKMFSDRVEVSVTDELLRRLTAGRKRVAASQ